jgi:hypothetical protein
MDGWGYQRNPSSSQQTIDGYRFAAGRILARPLPGLLASTTRYALLPLLALALNGCHLRNCGHRLFIPPVTQRQCHRFCRACKAPPCAGHERGIPHAHHRTQQAASLPREARRESRPTGLDRPRHIRVIPVATVTRTFPIDGVVPRRPHVLAAPTTIGIATSIVSRAVAIVGSWIPIVGS